MKHWIYFKMQKGSETEKVHFEYKPTNDEVEQYFEDNCGSVYLWSRTEF